MITTTKQEIRKAVMKVLESEENPLALGLEGFGVHEEDYPSVADRAAETLGGEDESQEPPCHWAESVKMADEMETSYGRCDLKYDGRYWINKYDFNGVPELIEDKTYGPYTLPYEKVEGE